MGCGEEVDTEELEIDYGLYEDRIRELFNFKILLLGAGESGKSTVVKQLKLVHKQKYGPAELRAIGNSLHMNYVDCMRALINAVTTFGGEIDSGDAKTREFLEAFDEGRRVTPDMYGPLMQLWNSEPIQYAYSRRSEFWLLDSFTYYLDNLERFLEEDFVPSEGDVVMARIRTTGIVATNLEQKIAQQAEGEPASLHFQVVDVGGQRNERKKWMHCFDDVKCVLFLVNLAGYNQVLFEDNTKNRMHESIELFSSIANKDIFKDTPIFLFLNKKDLFETMILEVDMKATFPKYTGGKDLANALNFIQEAFQSKMPAGKKPAHIQVVTGRHKRDIKEAFEEVKKTLYDLNRTELLAQCNEMRAQQRVIRRKIDKAANGCACFGGGGSSSSSSS